MRRQTWDQMAATTIAMIRFLTLAAIFVTRMDPGRQHRYENDPYQNSDYEAGAFYTFHWLIIYLQN